jgi:hypothetical protein
MATPFPFTSGQILTAAQMNSIGEAWIAYTPSWVSGGVAPAIGNGSLTGQYTQVNKMVFGRMFLVAGSTTVFGTGSYNFGLPVAAKIQSNFAAILSEGYLYDSNVGNAYKASATYIAGSGTTFRPQVYSNASQAFQVISSTTPVTLAINDEISISFCYEAA